MESNKINVIALKSHSHSLKSGIYQYSIPSVIPDTAREFLAWVECAYIMFYVLTDIMFYTVKGDQCFGMYLRITG